MNYIGRWLSIHFIPVYVGFFIKSLAGNICISSNASVCLNRVAFFGGIFFVFHFKPILVASFPLSFTLVKVTFPLPNTLIAFEIKVKYFIYYITF